MRIRIVTLPFDEELGGFPEEPLRQVAVTGDISEIREHFFVYAGKPYLTLLLILNGKGAFAKNQAERDREDPGKELPAELQPLYRELRHWRNERAKREGVPSYVLFRNTQLAEVSRRKPRTIAELREIEGVGEETCKKYGEDVLALIPPRPEPPAPAPGGETKP